MFIFLNILGMIVLFCNICLVTTLSVIDWYTRNCFFYIVSSYFMSTQCNGKHTNKARKLEKGVSIISGQQTYIKAK